MRLPFAALGLALVFAAPPGAGAEQAQNFGAPQARFLRVESSAGQSRSGRSVVSGYVYSSYGQYAVNVRLLVEQLDGAGQVIGTTIAHISEGVPPFGRAYFEAPMSSPGANYRVRVLSFDWLQSEPGH